MACRCLGTTWIWAAGWESPRWQASGGCWSRGAEKAGRDRVSLPLPPGAWPVLQMPGLELGAQPGASLGGRAGGAGPGVHRPGSRDGGAGPGVHRPGSQLACRTSPCIPPLGGAGRCSHPLVPDFSPEKVGSASRGPWHGLRTLGLGPGVPVALRLENGHQKGPGLAQGLCSSSSQFLPNTQKEGPFILFICNF